MRPLLVLLIATLSAFFGTNMKHGLEEIAAPLPLIVLLCVNHPALAGQYVEEIAGLEFAGRDMARLQFEEANFAFQQRRARLFARNGNLPMRTSFPCSLA